MTNIEKGNEYEFKILRLLRENTIECNSTRTSFGNQFVGDGNIDLFGNYRTMNFVMQLKFKDLKYKVGPNDIREFVGTVHNQQEGTIGIFVTNSSYTDNAKNIAENSKVTIILCKEDNLIESIKYAFEKYKNKSKRGFSMDDVEEIEIGEFEIRDIKISGIKMKGVKRLKMTL